MEISIDRDQKLLSKDLESKYFKVYSLYHNSSTLLL